ncbi:MAG: hypothetical protein QM572_10870 [Nocardioides sp.]|uniref:hypothetical protein n=1 Tax=Nocardioides sp. TaxID=35761 RepID=UPI0039E37F3B
MVAAHDAWDEPSELLELLELLVSDAETPDELLEVLESLDVEPDVLVESVPDVEVVVVDVVEPVESVVALVVVSDAVAVCEAATVNAPVATALAPRAPASQRRDRRKTVGRLLMPRACPSNLGVSGEPA